MKDLAHHRNKVQRRVLKSIDPSTLDKDLPPPRKQTAREMKLIKKRALTKQGLAKTPQRPTLEEQNQKMKKRVPIFYSASRPKRKGIRKTHKKTPRI